MRCNFFQCGHLFKCQTDRRGWKYEIRRLTQQREKPYLFCLFTSTVLFKWGSFIFYESRWKLSEVLKLELRYKPKMCSLIHDTVTFNTAAAAVFINVQRSWSSRSCVHARACACMRVHIWWDRPSTTVTSLPCYRCSTQGSWQLWRTPPPRDLWEMTAPAK